MRQKYFYELEYSRCFSRLVQAAHYELSQIVGDCRTAAAREASPVRFKQPCYLRRLVLPPRLRVRDSRRHSGTTREALSENLRLLRCNVHYNGNWKVIFQIIRVSIVSFRFQTTGSLTKRKSTGRPRNWPMTPTTLYSNKMVLRLTGIMRCIVI